MEALGCMCSRVAKLQAFDSRPADKPASLASRTSNQLVSFHFFLCH
jgi:hypothetical protein